MDEMLLKKIKKYVIKTNSDDFQKLYALIRSLTNDNITWKIK
jgi:hypothetical protein